MGTSLKMGTPMIQFEAREIKAIHKKVWHYLLDVLKIGAEEYQ
jgi:hypothetical protein